MVPRLEPEYLRKYLPRREGPFWEGRMKTLYLNTIVLKLVIFQALILNPP